MLRKEREIKDKNLIEEIINKASVCRIGMCDGDMPYVIPINYGYQDDVIYFHCALEGKKLEILRKNNNICFEVETDIEIRQQDVACSWGMKYKSVLGKGKAYFIEGYSEKVEAFRIIMRHYSDKDYTFPEAAVEKTMLVKVLISSFSGKQAG